MERRPSTDHRAWNSQSYSPLKVMKKAEEEFVKYGMTEAMTFRRDWNGSSRGPSTQTRFDRVSVIRILLLLGFCFFINSSKNLIFGVRILEGSTFL